uniref:FXYD domain-containing ion transport regulator n=1 Tax=Amphiprion percula TaxID=161767 RepID=A0A3P8SX38_AMPPE
METILLFLSSLLVCVAGKCSPTHETHTHPYYESLRVGGLALAVVLFALGILLILSKLTSPYLCRRCRCSINQKPRAPGDEEAQEENLIVSKGKMHILTLCQFLSPLAHPVTYIHN